MKINRPRRRQFASDTYSGLCPEAWSALQEANQDHAASYGEDSWTREAAELVRKLFETDCEVFFLFNGTAANALAVASMCDPFHSVVCHRYAHIETDECGAPGFFSHGASLQTIPGGHGKLSAPSIARAVKEREDVHAPKPRMISLSQATELGTVYTAEELHSIGQAARDLHLRFHIDGARFANAAAELEVAPRKLTWEAGVDVLSFGGTKNGMGWGEALVFFNRDLARDFERRQKQAAQLASKMRFLAAPWIGLLRDGAWLRHAARANQIARILEQKLRSIPSLRIAFPRQANSVFVDMPPTLVQGLHQRGWLFYTDVGPGAARFMSSWDSTEEDVEHLVSDIQDLTRETLPAL